MESSLIIFLERDHTDLNSSLYEQYKMKLGNWIPTAQENPKWRIYMQRIT